jgi:acetylornithine aminotransferase
MTTQTTTAREDLRGRFEAALMPTYGVPALALVRGEGSTVYDADGRSYLDLVAGIAVSALGHGHPALVDAVSRQVAILAHVSNLYVHPTAVALAERLLALLGDGAGPLRGDASGGRVFFANSGSEANEAARKLVRRARPDRDEIVAAERGFHGRTLGSLAITGKAAIREPFGPYGVPVRFVPYGDAGALRAAVTERTAAVFLEPALGEGGVVPPSPGYLSAARDACDDAGALLVLDEIQSGIGRTGTWFAHQSAGVRPDVVTLAKGLGGGLPIGACVGLGEAATALGKSDHGSTFGGNPVAGAAALAVLDTIERDDLLANATARGRQLVAGVEAVAHPLLAGVRGAGLWQALVLSDDGGDGAAPVSAAVESAARERGFLVNAVAPDAVRLAPPLIITADEIGSFVAALPAILDAAGADRDDA